MKRTTFALFAMTLINAAIFTFTYMGGLDADDPKDPEEGQCLAGEGEGAGEEDAGTVVVMEPCDVASFCTKPPQQIHFEAKYMGRRMGRTDCFSF